MKFTVLPADTMNGAGWGKVKNVIEATENGTTQERLVVKPGGELDIASPQEVQANGTSTTILPRDRMSSSTISVTRRDLDELMQLDPDNVEEWTVVETPWNNETAFTFHMDPPLQNERFKFLTFRDPSRHNLWQVSPIYPNYDGMFGHGPHMISTAINGQTIPVICGPNGQPYPNLAAVRGAAAKWTVYTSCKLAGEDPGFSI